MCCIVMIMQFGVYHWLYCLVLLNNIGYMILRRKGSSIDEIRLSLFLFKQTCQLDADPDYLRNKAISLTKLGRYLVCTFFVCFCIFSFSKFVGQLLDLNDQEKKRIIGSTSHSSFTSSSPSNNNNNNNNEEDINEVIDSFIPSHNRSNEESTQIELFDEEKRKKTSEIMKECGIELIKVLGKGSF